MAYGPLGDAIGLTPNMVYVLTVAQLPFMFVATLHYPAAKADFYATAARLVWDAGTNTTSVDLHNPTVLHYMHSVKISLLFLASSLLVCVFALLTLSVCEKGVEGNSDAIYETFTSDNVALITHPTVSLWNNVFLALTVTFHVTVLTLASSPTSVHFLLLVTLLTWTSLQTILQPRIQYPEDAGPGAASAVASIYMFAVAMFFVAMGYIVSNISYDPSSYKVALVACVAFFDVFLLVLGHTWDVRPNFGTILTARLFYACFAATCNLICYAAWHDCFRVHYFDTGVKLP